MILKVLENGPRRGAGSTLGFALVSWGAVAFSLAFALAHVRTHGFWIDEVYSIHAASLGWGEMAFDRMRRGHQPLYFAGLKVWMEVLPREWLVRDPEFWLRIPSLAGFAVLLAMWGWALGRAAGWRLGWAALGLLALQGLLHRQTIEVRMYALVAGLHGLALAGVARLVLSRGARRLGGRAASWVAAGVVGASALAALLIPASLLGSALLVAALWWTGLFGCFGGERRPWFVSPGWVAVVAFAVGVVVSLPGFAVHMIHGYRRECALETPNHGLDYGLGWLAGVLLDDLNREYEPRLVTRARWAVYGAALILAAGLAWNWRRIGPVGRLCAAMALPLPLIMATIGLLSPVLGNLAFVVPARYLTPMAPALAVAAASLLLRVPPVFLRLPLLGACTAALILMLTASTPATGMKFRKVAQRLRGELQPADHLLVVPHDVAETLRLYLGDPANEITTLWRFERDRGKLRRSIEEVSATGAPRIVLLSFRGGSSRAFRMMEEVLGPAWWPEWGQGYGGLDVLIWHQGRVPPELKALQAGQPPNEGGLTEN